MNNTPCAAPSRLYLREQYVLFAGPALNSRHRHHALQISVGLTKSFQVRLARGAWQECHSAIIPANAEHEFDGSDSVIASLFLGMESTDYQTVVQTDLTGCVLNGCSASVDEDLVAALRAFHEGTLRAEDAAQLCDRMIQAFLGQQLRHRKVDARITRVLEMIGKDPAEKIQTEQIAQVVGMSGSRLAHLFSAQVGIPIRRYRAWKAVREAIMLCLSGASMTQAALAVGFADSAHFSNTFRDMFGLTPTQILSRNAPVEVLF